MKIFAIVAALIAIVCGLWVRDSIIYYAISAYVLVFIGIPGAFILLIWFFATRDPGNTPKALKITFQIFLITMLGVGLTMWINDTISSVRHRQSRAYAERMVPLVEAYREKHGKYPDKLAAIQPPPPPPELLHYEVHYIPRGSHFEMSYADPTAWLGGPYLDSRKSEWQYSD